MNKQGEKKKKRKKERKKGRESKRVVGPPNTRPSADRVCTLDQACEDKMIKRGKTDKKNKQG